MALDSIPNLGYSLYKPNGRRCKSPVTEVHLWLNPCIVSYPHNIVISQCVQCAKSEREKAQDNATAKEETNSAKRLVGLHHVPSQPRTTVRRKPVRVRTTAIHRNFRVLKNPRVHHLPVDAHRRAKRVPGRRHRAAT